MLCVFAEKEGHFKGRTYHGEVGEDLVEEGQVLLDQELYVRNKSKLIGGQCPPSAIIQRCSLLHLVFVNF